MVLFLSHTLLYEASCRRRPEIVAKLNGAIHRVGTVTLTNEVATGQSAAGQTATGQAATVLAKIDQATMNQAVKVD